MLFPEHGTHAETLLQRGDVAMYKAKRSGGGYQSAPQGYFLRRPLPAPEILRWQQLLAAA
jgi:GGDEF domain-containing protein